MILKSETEMIKFGEELGKTLFAPKIIEFIGDVGSGKTTITKGIAKGLGVEDSITSPTFTLSKRYSFIKNGKECNLVHYDFYRLNDPGIMADDLEENLEDENTIVIIEWGDSVKNLLPKVNHIKYTISINDDGTRKIEENTL